MRTMGPMEYVLVFVLTLAVFLSTVTAVSPSVCEQCQQSKTCIPPKCSCCRDDLKIPNMAVSQIPQMVFFTFDDAVTNQVAGFYHELFDSARTNPNGCPISMTLFISHDNTDYRLVSDFHQKGMEIASHSVTHSQMNTTNFLQEAKSQKENLAKLANIPIEEITGWRSPFLKPTGDLQPDALKKLGYTYDATLTFSKRSLKERPPGPFTLDFGFPYECQVKPCPQNAHPGFWEIPVVSLMDYKQLYDCVYVDGCMNAPPDEESAYKFLWANFNNYYTTTRMPFGINMHPSWFFYPDRLRAMDRFIKKLVSMNDVYIVSANKMLEWLKNPTPLPGLQSFAPWACDGREKKFNTGPRLVKTNLPPPSSPVSWFPKAMRNSRDRITARTMRPKNAFTPSPVFPQRRFTPSNQETLRPRAFTPRAQETFPVQRFSQRRGGKMSDFTRKLELQQQKIREEILKRQLRHWQVQRRRQNPTPVTNTKSVKTAETEIPSSKRKSEAAPPPRNVLTQREIMEQHEERLRKHQMLEEKQKRLERERLLKEKQAKSQQSRSRKPTPPVRKPDFKQRKPIKASSSAANRLRKQQHVLWRPNMKPDMKPAETRQRRPVKVQQETIKLWPSSSPTMAPTPRIPNRSGRRFNPRQENELSRLRNRLRRPNTVIKPSPNPAVRTFPYSEAPVWFDSFGNRLTPFVHPEHHRARGGSNRRRGFVEPSPVPMVVGSQNQLTNSRIQTNLFNQQQQPIVFHDNSLTRSRNMRRNSISPSMAQRMAWDSFIRQMFGPH